MEKSDLLSTREASDLLGISLRTAQLWVESGVLRAWKTAGGHRRILRSSVDAVLAERRSAIGEAPPSTAPESERQQRPFRLLVVEDEPDLLKLYRLTIASWDLPLQLVTADNGFEGLMRVGEARPDLLITDLNMPGIDGFRMIRTLCADPSSATMELIAVTALGAGEIADRGGLPPQVTVMTKPVPFDRLEQRVRAAVERHSATQPG